jgi:hypothetical protein
MFWIYVINSCLSSKLFIPQLNLQNVFIISLSEKMFILKLILPLLQL